MAWKTGAFLGFRFTYLTRYLPYVLWLCCIEYSDDSASSSKAVRLQDDLHVTLERLRSLQTEIQNRDHVIKELVASQEQLAQQAKQVAI